VLHAVADNIFQTKHQDLLHEFRYFLQIWSSALVIEISKVSRGHWFPPIPINHKIEASCKTAVHNDHRMH
jgi:hypothetical protein